MTELSLDDYLRLVTQSTDATVRRNAAWMLGRLRDPRILPALITASADTDATVRVRVAESLGTIKDQASAVETLQNMLIDDQAEVRAQAVRSLGVLQADKTASHLIDKLNDDSVIVREQTAEALGSLTDDAIAEALIDCLIHDTDVNVRHYAAQSLGRLNTPNTDDQVIEALNQPDQPPAVLIDLIQVAATRRNSSVIPALEALTVHNHADVNAMAVWALSVIQPKTGQ